MPNHITNILEFKNLSGDRIRQIKKEIINDKGNVDFSILLPEPRNVWRSSEGARHEKTFGSELMSMNWTRRNWGTKWNAYDCRVPQITESMNGTSMVLIFDTAWNAPMPWYLAILNCLNVDFHYYFLDEGFTDNPQTGSFDYQAYIGEKGLFAEGWEQHKSDDADTDRLFIAKYKQTKADFEKSCAEAEAEEE